MNTRLCQSYFWALDYKELFTIALSSLVISRFRWCYRWLGHYLLTTLGTKNKPLQHLISQVLKGLIS
nr:MAG TPA: hypothetical protein [Caudoviricetes sp.]